MSEENQNTKTKPAVKALTASSGSSPIYPQPASSSDAQWAGAQIGGMTLREYFAGQALAGIMASDTWNDVPSDKDVAQYCVNVSDALCAKLSEKNT